MKRWMLFDPYTGWFIIASLTTERMYERSSIRGHCKTRSANIKCVPCHHGIAGSQITDWEDGKERPSKLDVRRGANNFAP